MNHEQTKCQNNEASNCTTVEKTRSRRITRPHYELDRRDEAFHVTVYVPGADRSSVKISAETGILKLEAERRDEVPAGWTPLRREIARSDYLLEIRVPEKVDVDAIKAAVADGVLELTLPIRAAERPRKIQVG